MPLMDNYLLDNHLIDGPVNGVVSQDGPNIVGFHTGNKSTSSTSFVKLKSVKVNFPGVYRWEQLFNTSSSGGVAILYVNGAQVTGVNSVGIPAAGGTFSQSVNVNAGDTIDLMARTNVSTSAFNAIGTSNLYSSLLNITDWILS
ncbi:MAG: hypothetical protein ACE3K2_04775 [Paenibacillus sp.]|uniref:hypothetical protein n=1 Tax=Paenibacillus sp. TaxID=58172 RepID=UPI003B7FA52C